VRRVIVVGDMPQPDQQLQAIMKEVSPDCLYWHVNEVEKFKPVTGDLMVPLGKAAIETVLRVDKAKVDDLVGQQYDAKVEGADVKVICQYHPGYLARMQEKKGGATERAVKAWFDVWDTVQEVSTGEEVKIPEVLVLTEYEDVVAWLEYLRDTDHVIGYDYETWGVNQSGENTALRPELCTEFEILTIGCAVVREDGTWDAFSFPFDWHREDGTWYWTEEQQQVIADLWFGIYLGKRSIAHFCKYEHKCNLKRFGRTNVSLMDTMLEDDTYNEVNDHKLHRVGARMGLRWMRYKSLSDKTRKNPKEAPLDKLLEYNALDALCTILSHVKLDELLSEQQLDGVARMEESFCYYLAKLEMNGMQVDANEASIVRAELRDVEIPKLQHEFSTLPEIQKVERWALRTMKKYQTKAYQEGRKQVVFSPKSPPMMKYLCMDVLKLPIQEVKVNGKYTLKFDKRTLEPYEEDVPVLTHLVNLRRTSAMLTGFLDKWEAFVDSHGKVHSQYNQGKVVTGRLSSTDPPQQNIPKKHRVRKVYVSRYKDGWLVNVDVKQQEPRLLAGWSKDEKMIEAINGGYDLHGFVASEIYGVPYLADQTEHREIGKRMNLGMMYGQTEYGLAAKTGMTVEAAVRLLKLYDRRFPRIAKQRQEWQAFAAKHGYAEDLFGRRRHLPDALSKDKWLRERALRQACNYPIQRTALVFTMVSMGVAMQTIEDEGLEDAMCVCGTVHDSIIGDAADAKYRKRLQEILVYGVEIHNKAEYWKDSGVPMKADVEWGRNLYQLEKAA
jgi:DNA polymerase I-like protein with 3'-5' exonuclease and polymerase domains